MIQRNVKADEPLFVAGQEILRSHMLKFAAPSAVEIAVSRIGVVAAAFASGGLGDDALEWRISKQKSTLEKWSKSLRRAVECRQALLDADPLLISMVTPTLVPLDGEMVSISMHRHTLELIALAKRIEQIAKIPGASRGNKPDFEVYALVRQTALHYRDCTGKWPEYRACVGNNATFFSDALYKLAHACSPAQAERVTPSKVFSAMQLLVSNAVEDD